MPNQSSIHDTRSFFLAVELLPNHLKDWSAFKDLVRRFLPNNQPGWTIVEPAEHGFYCGTFSVRTESDSEVVYQKLLKYREKDSRLLVHRFDTSGNTAVLLECNCHAIWAVPHMHQSRAQAQVQRSMVVNVAPRQPMYQYSVVPVAAPIIQPIGYTTQYLTNGFQNLSLAQVPYQQGYYNPLAVPTPTHPQYTIGPQYYTNSSGLAVNVSNGVIQTEHREVHISGIQYQVRKKELYAQIAKIAEPKTLELHVDHAGKFKGSAVATFESGAYANLVVARLNEKTLKGKKLRVRLGKQQTPVTEIPQQPLIVNGS